jgi:hypothetical protein
MFHVKQSKSEDAQQKLIPLSQADLLAEAKRRFIDKDLKPVDILFEKQKLFHRDSHRFKTALNTRRSGKSFLAAVRLLEAAKTGLSQNPYLALTRESARRILWPTLTDLIEKFKIPCTPSESSLTVSFPNKAEIFLVGADQKNFAARLRGIKARRAVIDEGQDFKDHLGDLIDSILIPTLVDFNGDLDIYGTPGIRPTGFFYEITTQERGFKQFTWSVLDNPFVPNAREFMEEILKRRNWTEENPTYRREWLGEWVLDLDALLFKFNRQKNTVSERPSGIAWTNVLGIDLGFNDATAFVVMSYSEASKQTFVIHSEAHAEMIPSEIAEKTKTLIDRFKIASIVADTGGLGKSIAEELKRRHGLPIKPAVKVDKATRISFINGDFIDRNLFVLSHCNALIDQLETVAKNEKGLEDDRTPVDLCDAMLYAYNESKHWSFEPKDPKLDRYSEDFVLDQLEKEAQRMIALRREQEQEEGLL